MLVVRFVQKQMKQGVHDAACQVTGQAVIFVFIYGNNASILPLWRDSASAPNFAVESMQVDMEVFSPVLKHLSW